MEATIEATLAEHRRDVSRVIQVRPRRLKISSEEQGRHDGSRQYFCVAHLALWVFVMSHCCQKVANYRINCYDFGVHGFSPCCRKHEITHGFLGSNLG